MSSKGPTPNPQKDQRERKYGWTSFPNVPTEKPAPPLAGDHTGRGAELWVKWWASPMATMWAEWDADALERLLDLYELHWMKEPSNLAEMRQLEDRYGLTPAGRRRLYWQIEGVDTPAKTPERLGGDSGVGRPRAGGASDPRLSVVQGGKKTG